MAITFERHQLYKDVWSRPLTKIAESYGLSDNGIRKICKAMNIPLPKAGHWAKVAAGHVVTADPLPNDAERTNYICHPPEADESEDAARDKIWCREQELQERLPANQIVVRQPPVKWHPILVPFRDSHQAVAKEYEILRKQAEGRRGKTEPRWGTPAWEISWKWNAFVRRGFTLIDSHKARPLRVSWKTYKRALAILNEMFFAAERRGFTVGLSHEDKRFVVTGLGGQFDIRLVERIETQNNPRATRKDGPWEPETIAVPTGQLRLCLESHIGSSIKEFADQEGCPLESQLNSVFAYSYRFVVRCRERTRIQMQEERQRALERSRREELLRQQREAARRIEEEKAKRAALMESAADWQRANLIRQYVAYVVSITADAECAAVADWKEWSMKVADELDPTTRSSLAASNSPVAAPDAGRSE